MGDGRRRAGALSLAERREAHVRLVEAEVGRLTEELKQLGARLVVLFGSLARGRRDLFADIDLLVVIPSEDDLPTRTARLYGLLVPRVGTELQ